MGKFCERTDAFSFSWEQVAKAFWFRYPNPYSAHVQTEDVLHRTVQNGRLYSKRLLTKTVKVPCFGIRIKNEPILEESIVDPSRKTITTYTRNIGEKTAVVEEKCVYKFSGEKQTLVERFAWITSSRAFFSRPIEAYMAKRFPRSINKTCLGLQHVLNAMFPPLTMQENRSTSLMEHTEKFKEKAKKLAKSRHVPILTAYGANNS